jgi:8-oxo-dGTP pyrophosphatase MutT (NUDIX family)
MYGFSMSKVCVCGSSLVFWNGKVLLLKHLKLGVWLQPGGHTEENETPQYTAVRETLEETGLKIRIIDTDNAIEWNGATDAHDYELPRPFIIMHEDVAYKIGNHQHFDMIYLAKKEGDPSGEAETALGWFGEEDIDGLETYPNVKYVLHKAFAKARELGLLNSTDGAPARNLRL